MATVSEKLQKIRSRNGSNPNASSALKMSEALKRRGNVKIPKEPSIDPYYARLERIELFSTNQCYYIIGSNKINTAYRIIKIDRTLIEYQQDKAEHKPKQQSPTNQGNEEDGDIDASHRAKPTIRPLSDFVTEDPNVYTQEEIKDMLDMIHDGNRMTRSDGKTESGEGGLKPIVRAYGIVGFIRFLDCYYLTLITKRAKIGGIGVNSIYTIKNTETVPLKPSEGPTAGGDDPSSVLLSMWNRGKRSVGLGLSNREIAELRYQGIYQVMDLSKNFFFSYTYDMTRSLQENFLASNTKPFPPPHFKDLFAWNHFLTQEFEGCLNASTSYHWLLPVIHGAVIQRKVNDYGKSLNLVLIARRSRHFAGTRYLKRGVSEQGKVANDVEFEQIIQDETHSAGSGTFSSYLQVRGSIPTFWTQESSVTMPKPPIELNRVDPTYRATRLHFEDLFKRYSSPILVLDLVKQSEKREREVLVGDEYRHAIEYINGTIDDEKHKLRYCGLDYSHISKHRSLDVSSSLNECSAWAVNQTGFFCSSPKWKISDGKLIPFTSTDSLNASLLSENLGVPIFPMEQSGVLRTNCIDCLDRTNVAQFSAGIEAMGNQLAVMGIRSKAKLDPSSTIVRVLIDMYVDIGDSIALQYGGSEAHKKVSADKSDSAFSQIGKHKEVLTSIRRYYSNAFTDNLKQDAMNLFLGNYCPFNFTVPLWELEGDYYLHNFHIREGLGTSYGMKDHQLAFGCADSGQSTSDHSTQSSSSLNKVDSIREKCALQNEALGVWWRHALHSNLRERMWLSLGEDTEESLLAPKFDRLYQPEKVSQWDKVFGRNWAVPARRPHGSNDDKDVENLLRIISNKELFNEAENAESDDPTLQDVISGINPDSSNVTLSHLTKQFDNDNSTNVEYVGKLDIIDSNSRQEYIDYVTPSMQIFDAPQTTSEEKIEDFSRYLHDCEISSDDVTNISKLSASAHLGRHLGSGPYKGLDKDDSAIEVSLAVYEQLSGMNRFTLAGRQRVQSELKRRGIGAAGVLHSVSDTFSSFMKSHEQYSEICGNVGASSIKSDLTTPSSLKLYASFFEPDQTLSSTNRNFLEGNRKAEAKRPVVEGRAGKGWQIPPPKSNFVSRAQRLGINITPREEILRRKQKPLFDTPREPSVPPDFEQINDDLFARKENKFMVFNGPGARSWKGTSPMTRIARLEDILAGST